MIEIHKRFQSLIHRTSQIDGIERRGHIVEIVGLVIESEGPVAAVGEICLIKSSQQHTEMLAEVVGFKNNRLLLMPLGELHGIHPGAEVIALGKSMSLPVSDQLKGRVLDGLGRPIDGKGPLSIGEPVSLHMPPPHPLRRQRISSIFETGIKAIDIFVPCGRGQRLGIFAGSGVGKSTLLGMIARHAEAEINIIALVGERGREVREFIERDLGEKGQAKSVIVVATSDQPPLLRLKAAFLAMSIAEHFRDKGKNVLFMMDSVTRFAMAQREIGLAVGEPPTTRGYTPSVFSLLPQLLERAGMGEKGSITAFFTVLVEADDMNDPIGDCVRSILDGHIVLSRELATQNHYPAIEVLESISRLARELQTPDQQALVGKARELIAVYKHNQDLINIGAYPQGTNRMIDEAIKLYPMIMEFLRQRPEEGVPLKQSWELIKRIMKS